MDGDPGGFFAPTIVEAKPPTNGGAGRRNHSPGSQVSGKRSADPSLFQLDYLPRFSPRIKLTDDRRTKRGNEAITLAWNEIDDITATTRLDDAEELHASAMRGHDHHQTNNVAYSANTTAAANAGQNHSIPIARKTLSLGLSIFLALRRHFCLDTINSPLVAWTRWLAGCARHRSHAAKP
jgi:hypothetical protein